MKCKASAIQEARHINQIGEPPSSAPQSNSPVQTILQRSRNTLPTPSISVPEKCWVLKRHLRYSLAKRGAIPSVR
ncbi:MAG: hypothetical protein ORN21_00695 [Methylophilaceae bacterium]|nr:hypothetical protein [Methylophilaceae bacterium]